MSKILNIVFDFGGVILTDDDTGVLVDNDELIKKYGSNRQFFVEAWDRNWDSIGENKIGIVDFYSKLQKEVVGSVDEKFSKRLFEIYKEKTQTLEPFYLLPKLKEKYNLFALTNIFKEGLEFKRQKYNLDAFFPTIIASCDSQVSKPGQKIFKILVESTNIRPEETLFIDNSEKNIKTAKALGFRTCLYTGIVSLKKEFEKIGISYE